MVERAGGGQGRGLDNGVVAAELPAASKPGRSSSQLSSLVRRSILVPVPALTDRLNTALAGRYRIERHLGEGGMAAVYLAEDLKHKRKVALKLLKPELAAVLGADRFVQEIATTASLQHPHILPLFDSGTADGFLYYVMPVIDGETLRAKLDRETQIGVDDAVRIAREVADALQHAHEHGIVHRDIKPENILLHGGHAMVGDFGIALAVSAAAGGRMTETGLSLGTPFYMSPEQATAEKEITARSDIYSLGSVLFEMLAGQPPHLGGSAQQIIMKIITESAAPVTQLRKSVPPHVAAAVAKSLEKLPADRFESAKAFADALGNPAYTNASVAGAFAAGRAGSTRSFRRPFIGVSVLAAVAISATVWEWRAAQRDESGTAVQFQLTIPPDTRMAVGPVAISPDGRYVVFRAGSGGVSMLYLRAIGDTAAHAISGTDGGGSSGQGSGVASPFFSPDGKWLGFIANGQAKKVRLDGGTVVPLSVEPLLRGASWIKGDIIVLGAQLGPLRTIPATGGIAKPVAALDSAQGETSQRWPLALDDGETVLYTSYGGGIATSTIKSLSLKTGRVRSLDLIGTAAIAVVEGWLVYATSTSALMAVGFNARRGLVTGSPVPVGDGVAVNFSTGLTSAAISRNGSLVYQSGGSASQLVLADLAGVARVLVPEAKAYSFPRFSPDGKQIAVGVTTATGTDVWIYDIASGTPRRLTSEGNNDRPEWSPDGKRVLYVAAGRARNGAEVWWQAADGSGSAEALQRRTGPESVNEGVLSADGHALAYRLGSDLWYRRFAGDTASKPIAAAKTFSEFAPRFSQDSRWVAYVSDQSGSPQVYVQAFPALGAPIPVTAAGGQAPVWAPDGRHIYYVANGQVNVATVSTTPAFTVTSRQQLFEGTYNLDAAVHANFDASPDGKHLLLVKSTGTETRMVVVHDWKYVLRERTAAEGKK